MVMTELRTDHAARVRPEGPQSASDEYFHTASKILGAFQAIVFERRGPTGFKFSKGENEGTNLTFEEFKTYFPYDYIAAPMANCWDDVSLKKSDLIEIVRVGLEYASKHPEDRQDTGLQMLTQFKATCNGLTRISDNYFKQGFEGMANLRNNFVHKKDSNWKKANDLVPGLMSWAQAIDFTKVNENRIQL